MFLNLGSFKKGNGGKLVYTPRLYLSWMTTWGRLNNTVVAYFDDDKYMNHFLRLRSSLSSWRTSAFLIKRRDLPAWKDLNKTREIFSQPGYPRFQPATVNAEYSCTMTAKMDALDFALTLKMPWGG